MNRFKRWAGQLGLALTTTFASTGAGAGACGPTGCGPNPSVQQTKVDQNVNIKTITSGRGGGGNSIQSDCSQSGLWLNLLIVGGEHSWGNQECLDKEAAKRAQAEACKDAQEGIKSYYNQSVALAVGAPYNTPTGLLRELSTYGRINHQMMLANCKAYDEAFVKDTNNKAACDMQAADKGEPLELDLYGVCGKVIPQPTNQLLEKALADANAADKARQEAERKIVEANAAAARRIEEQNQALQAREAEVGKLTQALRNAKATPRVPSVSSKDGCSVQLIVNGVPVPKEVVRARREALQKEFGCGQK